MRSFGIVFDEVLIKNGLHLLEGLKQAESVRRADEFAGPGKMIAAVRLVKELVKRMLLPPSRPWLADAPEAPEGLCQGNRIARKRGPRVGWLDG